MESNMQNYESETICEMHPDSDQKSDAIIDGLIIRRFRLTYQFLNKPFLWDIIRQRTVITNFPQAGREDDMGWMVLEIAGRQRDIDTAVQSLSTSGVQVYHIE